MSSEGSGRNDDAERPLPAPGQRGRGRPDLTGQVVVITGANSGIGREAAVRLGRLGATVVITSRSEQRGRQARAFVDEQLRRRGRGSVHLQILDLASFASIRRAAAELLDLHDRIDVLINNAGGVLSNRRETEDGFEMTFGVNHLGHFLLTGLLLDRLRASSPARIVNVSSVAHRGATMRWGDLQHTVGYSGVVAYNMSKLANVLFTRELARRLADTGVTANCCHPGPVRSGFGGRDDTTGPERWVMALARPFMVGPRRGSSPLVLLASSPKLAGVSGEYYVGGYVPGVHRHPVSREGRDPDAARRLWQESEALIAAVPGR